MADVELDDRGAVLRTELEGLELLNRGKVRDIYALDGGEQLVIVASDRISAYDWVMPNGIPDKGKLLTGISRFWLDWLGSMVPNHMVSCEVAEFPEPVARYADVLQGRSMLVRRAEVVPVECVVRGYLAGSGWREYKECGTVCTQKLPQGLRIRSSRHANPQP